MGLTALKRYEMYKKMISLAVDDFVVDPRDPLQNWINLQI
jgi:hypothetical protein